MLFQWFWCFQVTLSNPVGAARRAENKGAVVNTSLPSMLRGRTCLWRHVGYIYSYREEFLPPLLHCNKRGRGGWGRRLLPTALAAIWHLFGEEVTQNIPHYFNAWRRRCEPSPTEPAPLREGIERHRCQRISPSQTPQGLRREDKTFRLFTLFTLHRKMSGETNRSRVTSLPSAL